MPISRSQILSRIDSDQITIEPFSEGLLTPNGYDLSLSSEVYRMKDIDRPVNPLNRETLTDYLEKEDANGGIILEPFEPVSVLSKEQIGMEPSFMAEIKGRSSLGQLGVFPHLNSGIIDSGFGSEEPQRIVFTLMSCNPNPVVLYPNQPIAQLLFYSIEDPPTERTRYSQYETSPYPNFNGLVSTLTEDEFVLGVTGLPAAGKSHVAEILSELLNAETFSMGGVVREETESRGHEPTSDNIRDVSIQLREENGPGVIAELIVEKFNDTDSNQPRIIEGIRSPAEIETFRDELSTRFILLGVHSPSQIRLERMRSRERTDDEPSQDYLSSRDEKETKFGIRDAITMSDHIITNDGSLAELEQDVEEALGRVLSQEE